MKYLKCLFSKPYMFYVSKTCYKAYCACAIIPNKCCNFAVQMGKNI